ncbi:MAG: peptidoglycan DD-metalloendopeptidase family protein [Gammaproteobacteria bacterium]|nr:peptidoglycan DD-metalloendopeptidase family protein [Gammaproteobacteria bacterium]
MLDTFIKISLLSLLLLLNAGCAGFVQYEPNKNRNSSTPAKNNVTHHRVKAGETLYSIAFEYGRDYRDVARWNRISRSYTIYPKQKLRIVPITSDRPEIRKKKVNSGVPRVKNRVTVDDKTSYVSNSELKWSWPTQGKVVSTFSIRDPGRRGIDIIGRKGQPVKAAAAGRVVYRGNGLRGYGNLIIIKHNDTYFSAYAHTEDVVVKENEKVKLGQRLADMGNTSSVKTKLHFEIRRNGKPVNPMSYLPKRR